MKHRGYDYLVKITAVDYVDHLEAVYILRNIKENKDEILEVTLKLEDAKVPTLIDIHKSADWYEREMSEMFGIEITGRAASRLLLEKWDGVDPPLRKSFLWGATYRTSKTEKNDRQ
jgi:NADH:ubiquinone oxidoreductase subunit C